MKGFIRGVAMAALVAGLVAAPALSEGRTHHPDGHGKVLIGWGPTTVSATGYACPLFAPEGPAVGEIAFGFGGGVDVTVNGREAHFLSSGAGLVSFSPLDEASFPKLADVPAEFKTPAHSLMVFAAGFKVGENIEVAEPETPLARAMTTGEARCVYIIDAFGMPVYCLNCVFVFFQ